MAIRAWNPPLAIAHRRPPGGGDELRPLFRGEGRLPLYREHARPHPALETITTGGLKPLVGVARSRPERRHPDGFYATPEEATLALIIALGKHLDAPIQDPCCGDGAMARVLSRHGYPVIATDLVDRGYGRGGVDFLEHEPLAPIIVANPPFHLAEEFIRHAVPGARLVAFLLKEGFWHANRRIELHDRFPPAQELILTWRLDWTGQGRPTMNCTWWVWGNIPPARRLLPKPAKDIFA